MLNLSIYNEKFSFFSILKVPGVGNVPPSVGGSEQINTSVNPQFDAHTHVDPTQFPGIVHWGPEQVIASALPSHPPVDK